MGESDRTSGLDGTSTSLSFFLFVFLFFCLFSVRTTVARAYRPQFLRYRAEIVRTDCPIGGHLALKKILGVGPPGGGIFSQNFLRDFDLKMWGNNAHDPGKNMQKNFFGPDPPGLGGLASKVLELRFPNVCTRPQATVLEIL